MTFDAPLPEVSVHTILEMGSNVHRSWHDDNCSGGYIKSGAVAEVEMWIAVTELMQRTVELLGWQVSGDLLTGPPYQQRIWREFCVCILDRSHRKVLLSEG